jgi:hypothetical protein
LPPQFLGQRPTPPALLGDGRACGGRLGKAAYDIGGRSRR